MIVHTPDARETNPWCKVGPRVTESAGRRWRSATWVGRTWQEASSGVSADCASGHLPRPRSPVQPFPVCSVSP